MSIRDRLARLEKNRPAPRPTEAAAPVHEDDIFFYKEQWSRAVHGQELLPAFVYSPEDQKLAAEKTLSDTIPWLENSFSWSTPQGQELIEYWRAEAEQVIEDFHAGRLEETDSTQRMIERDFGGTLPEPTNGNHGNREDER